MFDRLPVLASALAVFCYVAPGLLLAAGPTAGAVSPAVAGPTGLDASPDPLEAPRVECSGCSSSGIATGDDFCLDAMGNFWWVLSEVFSEDGLCLQVAGDGDPDCVPAIKCQVTVVQTWLLPPGAEVRQCIDRGTGLLLCAYPPFVANGTEESDARSQPQACNGAAFGYQVNALTPCGLLVANAQVACSPCVF